MTVVDLTLSPTTWCVLETAMTSAALLQGPLYSYVLDFFSVLYLQRTLVLPFLDSYSFPKSKSNTSVHSGKTHLKPRLQ